MKELSANNMSEKKEKINRWTFSYKNHFLEPIKSGLFGFAIFITILIIVKLFSYLIGSYNYFAIEITDIELSLIGFVLMFLIGFLENFKETKTD